MDILLKTIQVLLALSLLILVHELGHFTFAKMFGIRVDKFYLFFDWGFSLLKWKPKNSDTEYGIGWLPLGGYCKIAGMVDESMDTDALKKDPQPWEFRSKPAWQRLLVMAGGVLFNLILAIIIYIGILLGWGESYIKNSDAAIYTNDISYRMGFRNGDRIVDFDGYVPDDFGSLSADLIHEQAKRATVIRDGDTVVIDLGDGYIPEILASKAPVFGLAVPFVISHVPAGSLNEPAFRPGDSLTAVDGIPMKYVQDVRKYLSGHPGDSVTVTVVREGRVREIMAAVDTAGMIQVATAMPPVTTREYNVATAVPAGIRLAFTTIGSYLKELRLIFNPQTEAYKEVGSFLTIGSIFPSSWDWLRFWSISALLSIMLGVVNLLPIPALDGGHIVFTLFEIVTGRKPGIRFLEAAQATGMMILLAIMVLAFWNDFRNFLF